MSLPQRAGALNQQFDREIDGRHVASIYKGMGISKQRFKSSLGPPKPSMENLAKQQLYIETAKARFEALTAEGYQVFQLDASLFNPDNFQQTTWAPQGETPVLPYKWSSKKYIACFAAISVESGCAHQMYKAGAAFKTPDIEQFLKDLKRRMGRCVKVAVFWDNASIHIQPGKDAPARHKIEVIKNAPYRPDLNGIEFFWGRIKRLYRSEVTRLRGQNLEWSQMELVQRCVREAGFGCAKDCAATGWRNLMKAVVKPSLDDVSAKIQLPFELFSSRRKKHAKNQIGLEELVGDDATD